MEKVIHYDYCVLGSGKIVNLLIGNLHISGRQVIVITNQEPILPSAKIELNDITFQTRSDFIQSRNQVSIHTLIVAVRTNLWSNEKDFDQILRKARECGVKKVVLFSSASVYGEIEGAASENSRLTPLNVYGKLKLLEEAKVVDAFQSNSKILVLRISNVYGDRSFVDITNSCIKSIKESMPLLVYSGGALVRDFIYIEDVAEILARLIQKELSSGVEYLNVSSGTGVSIANVISLISGILSEDIKQLSSPKPLDVVKHSVLDNLKLNQTVSFIPITLEEGLKKYIYSQFPELNKPL